MGREVRRVPKDWQHPKNERGDFIALLDGATLESSIEEYEEELAKWNRGERPEDYDGTFEEWYGSKPDPADYMPSWTDEEATHLMMYQNTSEGTPISPAFETPEELARWLADNKASAFADQTASYEAWLRTCQDGYAPSAMAIVRPDGSGIMTSGVEASLWPRGK